VAEQSGYFVSPGEQTRVTDINLIKKSIFFGDLRVSGIVEIYLL
jgi:hypothetical protein